MITLKDLKDLLARLPSTCEMLPVEVVINGDLTGEIRSVEWDTRQGDVAVILHVESEEVEAAIGDEDEDDHD